MKKISLKIKQHTTVKSVQNVQIKDRTMIELKDGRLITSNLCAERQLIKSLR